MKNFTPIDEFIDNFAERRMHTWFDKLSFAAILLVWVSLVFLFGLSYYFFNGENAYLYSTLLEEPVQGLVSHIYFSFITATTTGFGDIVPVGAFRGIAIFEVIFGFLLLAVVTSKLVSLKQDVILGEIYELSFREKINRVRSSLLVFRQNIARLVGRVEEKSIPKREINDLYMVISSFEDILRDINMLLSQDKDKHYTKKLDPLDAEVVINSVLNTFDKISEMISVLDQNKYEWRRDVTIHMIYKCVNLNQQIFDQLNSSRMLPEKDRMDLNAHKSKTIDALRSSVNVNLDEQKIPNTEIVN